MTQRSVAVIGMAGRFPGAKNVEELWRNVASGAVCRREYQDDELSAQGIPPELLRDPAYVKAGYPVEDFDLFDAEFFRMSPREAAITDPQQRLFLECIWNALESSGYDPSRYQGDIGIYAGSKMSSYLLNNLRTVGPDGQERFDSLELLVGNDKDYLTSRVSYKLNLRGPSIVIQTACSTSLVAVHHACEALLSGNCDMALAGGVSIRVPVHSGYRYKKDSILSPDGFCRAYSDDARGTVEGNGVAAVVLKRLEDAVADRDHILAVIRGTAVNNDGAEKLGFTSPGGDGQMKVIAEALQVAAVDPGDITLIEGHGTGTPLGDPVEVAALGAVFRRFTDKVGYCALASVKANIGHLDTAAGIAGLVKVIMALKHRTIAPAANYRTPNPQIDLETSPFYVPRVAAPWRSDGPRIAGVTSLGIGGTNCHVIVEEAPPGPASPPATTLGRHLLVLSARSRAALDRMARNLAAHLDRNRDLALADVAWTLLEGRRRFTFRRAVVCRDLEEATAVLGDRNGVLELAGRAEDSALAPTLEVAPLVPAALTQLADWVLRQPAFREDLDACAEATKPHLQLIEELGRVARVLVEDSFLPTKAGRLLEFSLLYALGRWLISSGVQPARLSGHETVCACLAGTLPLGDAINAVCLGPGATIYADATPSRVVIGGYRVCHWVADEDESIAGAEEAALRTLARLWTRGMDICARGLYRGEKRQRLPLPTYPFEYQRYWVEAPRRATSGPLVASPAAADPIGSKIQYAVPSWTWMPRFRMDLPHTLGGRRVLIIRDELGFGRHFTRRLHEHGCADFGDLEIRGPHDYRQYFDGLAAANVLPHYILYCMPAPELWDLMTLIQGIGGARSAQELTLAIVTCEAQDVLGNPGRRPDESFAESFVRSVPLEYPQIRMKLLDVDAVSLEQGAEGTLDRVLADLTKPVSGVIAYRGDTRWKKGVQAVSLPADLPDPAYLHKGGTYLVTGGLGGIASELCNYLAERGPCRFILLTRNNGLPQPQPTAPPVQSNEDFTALLESLCTAYAADVFRGLKAGKRYREEELISAITRGPRFRRYVEFLIRTLARAGVIERDAGRVVLLPALWQIESGEALRQRIAASHPQYHGMIDLLAHCAAHHAAIFSRSIDPLLVLYPDGTGKLLDAAFQNTAPQSSHSQSCHLLADCIRQRRPQGTIRVLEVGGGNGNLTRILLPALRDRDVQYCFTDISLAFVREAEALAREHGFESVRFTTLDITKNVESQGFAPESFDFIVALDVVHATADIAHTLRNLWRMLKGDGALALLETTRDSSWLTMVMGLTHGWWAFRDERELSPLLDRDGWRSKLESMSLGAFTILPESGGGDCSLIWIQKPHVRGTHISVLETDVSDPVALCGAIERARAMHGRIDGVIHTAGIADGKLLQTRTREDVEAVLAPKVRGVQNLYAAFRDTPLSLWVNCSSIVAVNGAVGQFAHCAANQYLDDFSGYLRGHGQPNTISINWEAWAHIGQAEASRRRLNEHIASRFRVDRNPRQRLLEWSDLGDDRYTIYETTLSERRDWFLSGHRVAGRAVVPGTVFVEMLVEAAQAVCTDQAVELSDVSFRTPLFVEPGTTLRVLTVLERKGQYHDVLIMQVDADLGHGQVHVAGRIRPSPIRGSVKLDLEDLEQACAGAELDQRVIDYDARWNCLVSAHARDGRGLAELQLPAAYTQESESYYLHPAMLDVATAFLPLQLRRTSSYVPVHYRKIVVFGSLPERIFSFARMHGAVNAAAESQDLNATLLDSSGARLVDIEKVSFRRVDHNTEPTAASQEPSADMAAFLSHVRRPRDRWLTPQEGVEAFGRILASGLQQVITTRGAAGQGIQAVLDVEAGDTAMRQIEVRPRAASAVIDFVKARPALNSEYIAPNSRTEKTVAQIWSKVLGIEAVGIDDNFFDLGGDSLLSIQVSSLIHTDTAVEVPSGVLFEFPTIRRFAEFLDRRVLEPQTPGSSTEQEIHAPTGDEAALIDDLVSGIRQRPDEL